MHPQPLKILPDLVLNLCVLVYCRRRCFGHVVLLRLVSFLHIWLARRG